MGRPRFTVVIPTRERAHRLEFSLRTCLAQRFDDYEIVVCDNCSSPATRAVVEGFRSPRIKYVRSDTPLAMSDNWELALSHAVGEYVTVIGDDDGLLLHALAEADAFLRRSEEAVVRFESVLYWWPEVPLPCASRLSIPLGRQNTTQHSAQVISQVARFRSPYTLLPMLYRSLVHRDVLDALRKKVGRVFVDVSPDIYSGFAIASIVGSYVSLGWPLCLEGVSAESNGAGCFFREGSNLAAAEFDELNAASGFVTDSRVPQIRCVATAVARSCFAAQRVHLLESGPQLDRQALVRTCVSQAVYEGDDQWHELVSRLRDSLKDDVSLLDWFDSELPRLAHGPKNSYLARQTRVGFDGQDLLIDSSRFGVGDVYGAALLYERLLGAELRDGESPRLSSSDQKHPRFIGKDLLHQWVPPALWAGLGRLYRRFSREYTRDRRGAGLTRL